MNTFWDLDTGAEKLQRPEALTEWLLERRLIEPDLRLRQADLRRALDVRDGLRALLVLNNGGAVDRDAVDRLNDTIRGAGILVHLHPTAPPDFEAQHGGLDAALGLIAMIVGLAQLSGEWGHLKSCPGAHCGWAFYDHSRNQTSTWCAMSVCGSRAKAREYRRRSRPE